MTGTANGNQYELQIPPGGLVYTGTLDEAGKAIRGTIMYQGVELHFDATAN